MEDKTQAEDLKPIIEPTKWLKGSSYIYNSESRTITVHVPNSATSKEFCFRGKKQCDLVQCLLDTIWRMEVQSDNR